MKCPKCGHLNKEGLKACKKCNTLLVIEPLWTPDWQTHRKMLIWIFSTLLVVFFGLKLILHKLPDPYRIRQIPLEVTPWLKK